MHHPLLCGTLLPSFLLSWRAGALPTLLPMQPCLTSAFFLLESKITQFMDIVFNPTNAFSRVFEELTLHRLLSFEKNPEEAPGGFVEQKSHCKWWTINVCEYARVNCYKCTESERSCCFAVWELLDLEVWGKKHLPFFFSLLPGTAAFTELIEKCNIIHLQEKLMKFAGSGNVLQKANSHLNMHEKGAQCDPHE